MAFRSRLRSPSVNRSSYEVAYHQIQQNVSVDGVIRQTHGLIMTETEAGGAKPRRPLRPRQAVLMIVEDRRHVEDYVPQLWTRWVRF